MSASAEPIYFVCPACGVSFKVASWFSERIFCARCQKARKQGLIP